MDTNRLTGNVFWYANRKAQTSVTKWCFETMKCLNMDLPDFKYKIYVG